jgi:heme/copper-type cytochrome/quinol oxidase subunit 2
MNSRNEFLRRCIPLLVLCAVVLVASEFAYACPNCKAGMSTSDPHAKSMAAGYYYSILFMLSMPFLIVTSFSGWMYFAVRKAKAERDAKAMASNSVDDSQRAVSTATSSDGSTRG